MFLCRDAIFNRQALLCLVLVMIPIEASSQWKDTAVHARAGSSNKRDSYEQYRNQWRRNSIPDKKAQNTYSVKKTKSLKYRIRRGDTLFSIARKYNCSVNEIARINNLRKKNKIRYGMILKIPVKSGGRKRTADTGGKAPSSGKPAFSWPVKKVVSCKRDGIDGVKAIGLIITAPAGSAVLSSAPGTVQKVGFMRGYGNFVMVRHSNRYFTVYSRLEKITVREGQHVITGSQLGRIDTGSKNIHFQIDRKGKSVNPLKHLPKRG